MPTRRDIQIRDAELRLFSDPSLHNLGELERITEGESNEVRDRYAPAIYVREAIGCLGEDDPVGTYNLPGAIEFFKKSGMHPREYSDLFIYAMKRTRHLLRDPKGAFGTLGNLGIDYKNDPVKQQILSYLSQEVIGHPTEVFAVLPYLNEEHHIEQFANDFYNMILQKGFYGTINVSEIESQTGIPFPIEKADIHLQYIRYRGEGEEALSYIKYLKEMGVKLSPYLKEIEKELGGGPSRKILGVPIGRFSF
ncbi:MAG: hypothetical protein HYW24_04890 [Candidatus Aenigmarchaeota archaeon]|nr:hypothetical protein [Candidatus Aenigmarchaeota archaeon]